MQDAGDTVLVDKDDNCDVAVIWSVLWQGRMANYRSIWNEYRTKNKPVVVVEEGIVRRAKLYYLRGLSGKAARIKRKRRVRR